MGIQFYFLVWDGEAKVILFALRMVGVPRPKQSTLPVPDESRKTHVEPSFPVKVSYVAVIPFTLRYIHTLT